MTKPHRIDQAPFLVRPGSQVRLADYQTEAHDGIFAGKKAAKQALADDSAHLAEAQRLLWASGRYSLLIILQGLDAAGKDGTIRHVMRGVNPQGCAVHSFKAPNSEELSHHFLWRPMRFLPPRGMIAIFNRSYYEEVLVVRVHPQFLEAQNLPPAALAGDIWQTRFDDINGFERVLAHNGTRIVKFYLHLSRKEQKKRFLDRLNRPEKHWKFNDADLRERGYWNDYTTAYEAMLSATSTEWAPWYIMPADDKWFTRACIADIIAAHIESLDLAYPTVSDEDRAALQQAKAQLEHEDM